MKKWESLPIWKGGNEIKVEKIKLESYCTVFQVKLCAIYRVVKSANGMGDVIILIDSRSALEIIKNTNDFHPIAFAIRRNIKMQGLT